MKYLFSDFYLLVAAAEKETRTAGDAYRRASELMGVPVSAPSLLFSLRGLLAGGYIHVSPADGVISVTTPVSVTDAGRKAATISGMQKFFGEFKAFNKNEMRFCSLDRPEATVGGDWTVDTAGFAEIANRMMQDRAISYPLFELAEAGEGLLTLTVHHPGDTYSLDGAEDDGSAYDPDAPEYADSVSVTGDTARIMQSMSDLLTAADGLLTKPNTRKIALHGGDRSYIVTLANAASEYGTALRMTVSQIRFNRQRFYGKRDGELDYAQCGEPVITHEMAGAAVFAAQILPCAAALPELLGPHDTETMESIHKKLKK